MLLTTTIIIIKLTARLDSSIWKSTNLRDQQNSWKNVWKLIRNTSLVWSQWEICFSNLAMQRMLVNISNRPLTIILMRSRPWLALQMLSMKWIKFKMLSIIIIEPLILMEKLLTFTIILQTLNICLKISKIQSKITRKRWKLTLRKLNVSIISVTPSATENSFQKQSNTIWKQSA